MACEGEAPRADGGEPCVTWSGVHKADEARQQRNPTYLIGSTKVLPKKLSRSEIGK